MPCALAFRSNNSFPVACVAASTRLKADSKSPPTFTANPPKATIAADNGSRLCPTPLSISPAFTKPARSLRAAAIER